MRILAVETATSWQSVAIVEDGSVLAREDQDAGGAHGLLLLPAIDRLLERAGLQLESLDGLACSIGPGSFTGIRAGVATCLGLRAAADIPFVLVPTLEAMAWGVNSAARPICPMLTGRRGELYWAIFHRTKEGGLARLLAERVGPPEAVADSFVEDTTVFGEGWSMMEAEIRAALSSTITVYPAVADHTKPSAVAVALVGMQRLQRGEVAGDQVMPLYVQRAEAEIKYEQSGERSPVARRQARVAAKVAQRLVKRQQRRRPAVRPERSHDL